MSAEHEIEDAKYDGGTRQVIHNLYEEALKEARTQRERAVIAEARLHAATNQSSVKIVTAGKLDGRTAMERCYYADESLRRAFADGVDAALGIK